MPLHSAVDTDAPPGINLLEIQDGRANQNKVRCSKVVHEYSPGQDPTESPSQDPEESPDQDPTESPGQDPTESPDQETEESPDQESEESDDTVLSILVFVLAGYGALATGGLAVVLFFFVQTKAQKLKEKAPETGDRVNGVSI